METYYVETCGRTYFNVEDNVIHAHGKRITMPKQKLLDFIATAKELGERAGHNSRKVVNLKMFLFTTRWF